MAWVNCACVCILEVRKSSTMIIPIVVSSLVHHCFCVQDGVTMRGFVPIIYYVLGFVVVLHEHLGCDMAILFACKKWSL